MDFNVLLRAILRLIFMALTLFQPLCEGSHKKEAKNVIHISVLVSRAKNFSGRRLVSGFIVGVQNIRWQNILPGYEIEYRVGSSQCNARNGVMATINNWRSMGSIDGIMGDTCSVSCQPVGLIAAAWNVPMVSNLCTSDALSDPKMFPTFTRVVGVFKTFAFLIEATIKTYNWTRVAFVTDTADLFKDLAIKTRKLLINQGITVLYYAVSSTVDGDGNLIQSNLDALRVVIRELKDLARVIYIMAYAPHTRNALALAYEEGMYNGEYVFLGIEDSPVEATEHSYRKDIPHNEIWQGFTSIQERFTMASVFREFQENCSKVAKTLPKQPDAPDLVPGDINKYPALMYDSIWSWALAVNKTLEQGYRYNDGIRVTDNIINATFRGMTGAVVIDNVGNRMYDYEIWSFQNGTNIPILWWSAEQGRMVKLHKPEDEYDWSGIFWFGNSTKVPKDSPACGWKNEFCVVEDNSALMMGIGGGVTSGIFLIIMVAVALTARHVRMKSKLKEAAAYIVPWNSIQLMPTKGSSETSLTGSKASIGSEKAVDNGKTTELAKCNNLVGVIKRVGLKPLSPTNDRLLNELRVLKSIKHDNLNTAIAVCLETPNACILMQFAQRGSFHDVISSGAVNLTWDFKASLICDVADGMTYLHSTEVGYHGHLTSLNCVIDFRWIGKVTDYGLRYMKEESLGGDVKPPSANKLLWTAPEILKKKNYPGSKEGDVYSFAIIAQEVILEKSMLQESETGDEAEEIVRRIAASESPPYRPSLNETETVREDWMKLIQACWAQDPINRPTFQGVKKMVREINKERGTNLMQIIIKRLEEHTQNLEIKVEERKKEIIEEKAKMEILLLELIPPSVVKSLMKGKKVEPESFDGVTIFFSDVVSFTKICAAGTAHDVVKMLNLMYTLFDEVSSKFDVYKVATIGDAYFVGSGVPIRNGNKHAEQICGMALQLLEAVMNFPIPHIPSETLKLRIGVHSGSVVAGVCGVKMPRYLLFGDTVDIASKMESSGASMAIHISQVTYDLLKIEGNFKVEERGITDIKGIADTTTYWLKSDENVST